VTLPSRLYVIIDPLDTDRDPLALTRAVLAGGARLLQLRLKTTATGELLATAAAVRELTAAVHATFILNDRADVARACGADGVHLGQDDLPVASARAVVGPNALIGFSTHSETQLAAARSVGADYLAFGPIFATTSKSAANPVLGCERLQTARGLTVTPLVAIVVIRINLGLNPEFFRGIPAFSIPSPCSFWFYLFHSISSFYTCI